MEVKDVELAALLNSAAEEQEIRHQRQKKELDQVNGKRSWWGLGSFSQDLWSWHQRFSYCSTLVGDAKQPGSRLQVMIR